MRRQPAGFQSATAREKIPPHGAETKRRPKAPIVVRSVGSQTTELFLRKLPPADLCARRRNHRKLFAEA
jgi:hypothetical protein